jgi:F0F1-type ATP synthase membrane subunit b/b'
MKKLKKWILLVLSALVSLVVAFLMGRKSEWAKQREKEIEEQENTIKQAENEYDKAGEDIESEQIDSPSAGAEYIDDLFNDLNSK